MAVLEREGESLAGMGAEELLSFLELGWKGTVDVSLEAESTEQGDLGHIHVKGSGRHIYGCGMIDLLCEVIMWC